MAAGDLYAVSSGGRVYRRAGGYGGASWDSGIAGPAGSTNGIAFDAAGDLYIVSFRPERIYRRAGGYGGASWDSGAVSHPPAASSAQGITFDAEGNLYLLSFGGRRIYRRAGGYGGASWDSGIATGGIVPRDIAFDPAGDLYFVDSERDRVYRRAGGYGGASWDSGIAVPAGVREPDGIAFDAAGDLYLVDNGGRVYRRAGGYGGASWDSGIAGPASSISGIAFEPATVSAPSFTNPTGTALTTRVGSSETVTVPEAAGRPSPTYAAVGTLPRGVTFNATTRVLTVAPTAVARGTITIRATNSQGSADWTVAYNFTLPDVAPSFTDATGDAISGRIGQAITPVTVPAAMGRPTPTYAVQGNLPGGIEFNTGTRVLSGSPTGTGSGTITIRATNSQGNADWTVSYNFLDPVPSAPSFTDATGDAFTAKFGQSITEITVPEAMGFPAPTYAVVGRLPAGLQFNTRTRVLSGTPTEGATGTIRIRATNSQGSADWTVDYTILGPLVLSDLEAPAGRTLTGAALLVRTEAAPNWYRDSDRGGTDTVLDGSLDPTDGDGPISRIYLLGTQFRFNDNDTDWDQGTYWASGGDGHGLQIHIMNDDREVATISVASTTVQSSGGNFINFQVPQSFVDHMNTIDSNERWIIGFSSDRPPDLESNATFTAGVDASINSTADVLSPLDSSTTFTAEVDASIAATADLLSPLDATATLTAGVDASISSTASFPPPIPVRLPAPTVVSGSISSTYFSIESASTANADQFRFRYSTSATDFSSATITGWSTSLRAILSGLTAGTSYYVQVQARNDRNQENDWSPSSAAITTSAAAPAGDIGVTATPSTNSVRLRWPFITDSTLIDIDYAGRRRTISGFQTSVNITGLVPYTNYNFVVRARRSGGLSTLVERLSVRTLPIAPAFTNPTGTPLTTKTRITETVTVPAASGTPAPSYAVVGALPAGVSFDPATRVLTVTPTVPAAGTIRIRATNIAGTADWTVAYAFEEGSLQSSATLDAGVDAEIASTALLDILSENALTAGADASISSTADLTVPPDLETSADMTAGPDAEIAATGALGPLPKLDGTASLSAGADAAISATADLRLIDGLLSRATLSAGVDADISATATLGPLPKLDGSATFTADANATISATADLGDAPDLDSNATLDAAVDAGISATADVGAPPNLRSTATLTAGVNAGITATASLGIAPDFQIATEITAGLATLRLISNASLSVPAPFDSSATFIANIDATLSSQAALFIPSGRPLSTAARNSLIEGAGLRAHFIEIVSGRYQGGVIQKGILRLCSAAADIDWNGETWTAYGGKVDVGTINETIDFNSQRVTITLSSDRRAIVPVILNHQLRGHRCRIWRVIISGGTVIDNPILIFDGLLSGEMGIVDNFGPTGGGSEVKMTAISRLAVFDQTVAVRNVLASHREYLRRSQRPADELMDPSFEFVQNLNEKTISGYRAEILGE